jgi:hypothetical protein
MKRKDSFSDHDNFKSVISQLKISGETLVFLFGWIGITSFIIANFHLQGNNIQQTESAEKFWYLTLLLTTWIILYFSLAKEKFSFKNSMLFQIIGLITAATGLINWVGDPAWHKGIWLGFEWPYLLIYALVFLTLLMVIMNKITIHYKSIRVFIFLLSIYSVVSFILTAWQDNQSISDKYSYSFVNNELLGPSSGKYPFINFNYQYSALQGFIISPIKLIDSSFFIKNMNQITAISLSVFACATAIMAMHLIKKITATKNNLVALGLACGWLNFAQFNQIGAQGSLLTPQTSIQIRLFSMFLVILCLNKAFNYLDNSRLLLGWVFFFLAFLSAINNQDFGLISFASMMILRFFYNKNKIRFTIISSFYLVVSVLIFIVILRLISGQWISAKFILFFQRNYSSSFVASSPIDFAGPVLIVVPFLLAGFFIPIIVNHNSQKIEYSYLIPQAIALSGILSFPYFLNRSIASTQLQIFIPIAFLSLLPTLIHFFKVVYQSDINTSSRVVLNPFLVLLLSIGLSLVMFSSKPMNQIDRIFSSETRSSKGFLYSVISKEDLSAISQSGLNYFGENANMVSSITGVKTLNIFNQTGDVLISPKALEFQCKVFEERSVRQVVANWDALDPVYKNSPNGLYPNNFCIFELEEANIFGSTFSVVKVTYE